MVDPEIVEVYSAANLTEAYFVRDLLTAAEIEVRVVGETLGSGVALIKEAAPRLWVHVKDVERARAVIAEYERVHTHPHPDDAPASTWTCPNCHEEVETDLDLCWNCQTPRQPY